MKALREITLRWFRRHRIAASLVLAVVAAGCGDLFRDETEVPSDLNARAIERILAAPLGYPVRFVIMGDVQPPGWPRFARMREQINDLAPRPLFALILGDLTNSGSLSEFKSYTNVLAGFDIPVVSIIGNHEQYDPNGLENFRRIIGPEDFYFDYHGLRFIAMNDSRNYGLEDYQLEWLDNTLAGAGTSLVYIFLHAALVPESYHGTEFYSILDGYRDRIVFLAHGHKHSFARFTVEDFPCIISGGGGGNLDMQWSVELYGFVPPVWEPMFHFIELGVDATGNTLGRVFRLGQGTTPDPDYEFMIENPMRDGALRAQISTGKPLPMPAAADYRGFQSVSIMVR